MNGAPLDTVKAYFGRDDAVLVTAWCLGADYEVGP